MELEFSKLTSLDQIPLKSQIVLCGAGAMGKFAFDTITKSRKDISIIYFIDDSKKGTFEGVPILSRDEYSKKNNSTKHYVIVSSTYWQGFSQNLIKSGINNFVIFDLLSQKGSNDITEKKINSVIIRQYTPNLFLELSLKNIHNIEPKTISWIDTFNKGSVFYDIGASNGIYAIYSNMASSSNVVAIEADAQNFSLLQRNCYLNNISPDNFTGINIALGSESQILKMHSEEFVIGMHSKTIDNSGREFNQKKASFSFNTLVEALDVLIERYKLPIPDYFKLDVDGAEFDVLKGCRQVLTSNSVELLIETSDMHLEQLDKLLAEYGYNRSASHEIYEIIGSKVEGVKNHLYKK